jgi:hypothetical protein
MRNILTFTAAALFCLPLSAAAQSYDDPMALVDSWYRAYLGRSALDDPGSAAWLNLLRQGNSPLAVQAGILASDEYYNRNGGTPQGYIQGLYRDALRRSPTPVDYDFWVRRAYTQDRTALSTELLTLNPGSGILVAPLPPPVIIQDHDRRPDRVRELERERERRRDLERERERREHDYRRPVYPYWR